MTKKPTAVLDTNIYLSAIIFGGNPKHILDLIIVKKINSLISPGILLEISQKLSQKFKWDKEKTALTIKTIAKTNELVYPKEKLKVVREDLDDNKIIEAAREGKADFIITGDSHLLKIKSYKKIKSLSPMDFLTHFLREKREDVV